MAINSVQDIAITINVSKSEYEDLVRSDEVNYILRGMFRQHKYVDGDTVRAILGVEFEEDIKNGGK